MSEEYRDELPEDLDVTQAVIPYSFPTTRRRRIMAVMSITVAVFCFTVYALSGESGVLVNQGTRNLGICLIVLAIYFWFSAWKMVPSERDALATATKEAPFAVGHASAQLGWSGLLSRPAWRILLYSDENPPKSRGVVIVDAAEGGVVFASSEENPEDWASISQKKA